MYPEDKIKEALVSTGLEVFHYFGRPKKERYIVWAEDGEGDSLRTDNGRTEKVLTGTADLFTKTEGDAAVRKIEEALELAGISFYLNSVQYEDETGYIHFEWRWEAV